MVAAEETKLPALGLTEMINEGISVLLDLRQFQNERERADFEKLCRNAFQVDPLTRLLYNLQHCGGYASWLERCFQLRIEPSRNCPPILERLLELQNQGALLVYTGCDDTLSRLTSQRVHLPTDSLADWMAGRKKGFLNVHGVYWKPESLQLNCEAYTNPSHPSRVSMGLLEQLFQQKSVIAVGTCDRTDLANPMLAAFAQRFLFTTASNMLQNRFHLSLDLLGSSNGQQSQCGGEFGGCVLNLPLFWSQSRREDAVGWTVISLREPARLLYEEMALPAERLPDHHMITLLVETKRGAAEISKMMFDSPGANFALVNSISSASGHTSHTVTVRVELVRLSEFWVWLWVEKRELLMRDGLLAVMMQSGTIVWCQARIEGKDPTADDPSVDSSQDIRFIQQMNDGNSQQQQLLHQQHVRLQQQQEQDCGSSKSSSFKSISPLVMQEFSIPKLGGKVVPRYTMHKLNTKFPRTSSTLPMNGISSSSSLSPFSYHENPHFLQTKSHLNGFSDDIGTDALTNQPSKNVLARRSSLPQQLISNQVRRDSDGMLFTLAEHCRSVTTDSFPPSYTAIKQALLCDQYKRRPSTQSDAKTLKNLLKTKLVISDDTNDVADVRRKSDPGMFMKQRDFERRKELFMDENTSWSTSYGKVIAQQIGQWQKKRQNKQLQKDMLNWQAQTASTAPLNPVRYQIINPLIPGQPGITNPLQLGDGLNANSTSATLFPGNLSSGCVVGAYHFPQAVLPGPVATATPSIYYNPLRTPYTFVNPYQAMQIGQVPSVAPPPATYLIPQTAMPATQPKLLYYVPPSTNSSSSPVSSSSSSSVNTSSSLTTSNSLLNSSANVVPVSTSSPPRISLVSPPSHQKTTHTWLTDHTQFGGMELNKLQPVSPNSRKRHQSVPEKLTSLLQLPTPTSIPSTPLSLSSLSSGRSSPMDEEMDGNPDSPPLSKKQRSISDTTVYHSNYRLHQLSPGRGRSPTSSQANSPQPPHGSGMGVTLQGAGGTHLLEGGLSPLQAHLLQVHQSYGISRSAVEERRNRRHNRHTQDRRSHSPLRKYSGSSLNNGSISPPLSLMEEEEVRGTSESGGESVSVLDGKRELTSDIEGREMESETGSEQGSSESISPQLELWQFLLELLISSNYNILHWTDNEFEFQITKPAEVSQLWGQFTRTSDMTGEQLLSMLSASQFREGIVRLVEGRKLTFRFDGQVKDYVRMRRFQSSNSNQQEGEGNVVVVVE